MGIIKVALFVVLLFACSSKPEQVETINLPAKSAPRNGRKANLTYGQKPAPDQGTRYEDFKEYNENPYALPIYDGQGRVIVPPNPKQ